VTAVHDRVNQLTRNATELLADLREVMISPEITAQVDPVGLGDAVVRAAASLAARPGVIASAMGGYSANSAHAVLASLLRSLGIKVAGPAEVPDKDRRHADPAYDSNGWYFFARQEHLLFAEHLRRLADKASLDRQQRAKLDFAINQVIEATDPANFPPTNPAVLKRAIETGGLSLVRGLRNFSRDVLTNRGQPRQVTPGQFQVGRDLAVTPGKVVFRNRLIELIQYEPATDTTYQVPILFSPPWINKYYIMDLAPGKSLVEWAVRHGHTCFMISYRNPDEEMRDVTMSDYLREGLLASLEVVKEIADVPKVNVVGLCLGGTLAAATTAWLAFGGDPSVNSLTLLNTLLDFQAPGQLGVFTDEDTVERLERRVRRSGYLPGQDMKSTFDLLRATDLIWNYVVTDWMLGEDPAPFDMLTWNSDSTRMPAAMQVEYLRSCYMENQLAKGTMTLADRQLDLGKVNQDAYLVTAEADHIAPWRAVYAGARLLGGTVRFVLSNSGHIAGVVNPPSSKSKRWLTETHTLPADPDSWRAGAEEQAQSWWEDWAPWIAERGGEQRPAPPVGSKAHPAGEDAPGSYVRG
jgi:polyhydroxyalkanoate synthase